MISYVKGLITFKTPTYIVVEAGGLGYHINISLNTYGQIEKAEQIKILTHFIVREDSQTLYGFSEEAERQLFIKLISVSGIGPNTAIILLSSMKTDEVKHALINEDVGAFNRVKGIGPKTAKRIILDLKDKVLKESGKSGVQISPVNNTLRTEALSALVALGFNRIQVQKVLNKVLREHPAPTTVEDLIKRALNGLSS